MYLVDTGVANVEQVRRSGLDHHGAEGADITTVPVVPELAATGLGMKPGIGGQDHPAGRLFYRPGIGGAVVILQETGDGSLAGFLTDIAGADAVRQGHGNPLGRQLIVLGRQAPWKSWFTGFGPRCEYCPTVTRSRSPLPATDANGPIPWELGVSGAMESGKVTLRRSAHVGGVQGQAGKGQAAHQVADDNRQFIPDEVIHQREVTAEDQA